MKQVKEKLMQALSLQELLPVFQHFPFKHPWKFMLTPYFAFGIHKVEKGFLRQHLHQHIL